MFKFQELSHEDFVTEARKIFSTQMSSVVDSFIMEGFTLTPVYIGMGRGSRLIYEPCEISDSDGFLVAIGGMYKFVLQGKRNAAIGSVITPMIYCYR